MAQCIFSQRNQALVSSMFDPPKGLDSTIGVRWSSIPTLTDTERKNMDAQPMVGFHGHTFSPRGRLCLVLCRSSTRRAMIVHACWHEHDGWRSGDAPLSCTCHVTCWAPEHEFKFLARHCTMHFYKLNILQAERSRPHLTLDNITKDQMEAGATNAQARVHNNERKTAIIINKQQAVCPGKHSFRDHGTLTLNNNLDSCCQGRETGPVRRLVVATRLWLLLLLLILFLFLGTRLNHLSNLLDHGRCRSSRLLNLCMGGPRARTSRGGDARGGCTPC